VSSAFLIGDDELSGACDRVRCVGVRSVGASKQWLPEDGSKVEDGLDAIATALAIRPF
jgi:hypothetical protein